MLGGATGFGRNLGMLSISQVPGERAPMDLLLLADPLPQRIAVYLPASVVFVAREDDTAVAVAVPSATDDGASELKNLDALLASYADDAQLFEHPAKLLARGAAGLREHFAIRFQESNLHATLRQRIVMDAFVIDHETVTRTFPEGTGTIDLIMTCEVRGDRIARAGTLAGPRTLAPA